MVYGNAGYGSGAGVGFTRNPATGARELYFDFQFNAQGEDVVSGRQKLRDHDRLRLELLAVWSRLSEICQKLEALLRDAQDFEFTVQSGALFLLQTRRAKRTDWAALAIAVDMVDEGLITPAEGLSRLAAIDLDSVVRTSFPAPRSEALERGRFSVAGQQHRRSLRRSPIRVDRATRASLGRRCDLAAQSGLAGIERRGASRSMAEIA
jgi:pyruvate,orthophosphate dikinase